MSDMPEKREFDEEDDDLDEGGDEDVVEIPDEVSVEIVEVGPGVREDYYYT